MFVVHHPFASWVNFLVFFKKKKTGLVLLPFHRILEVINGYCNYVPFIQEKILVLPIIMRDIATNITISSSISQWGQMKYTKVQPLSHTHLSLQELSYVYLNAIRKLKMTIILLFFPHLILASFNFVTQPFGLVQSCCTPKKQIHEKRGEKTSIRKDIVERFSGFRNTFETVQLTYELSLRVISAVVVVNV